MSVSASAVQPIRRVHAVAATSRWEALDVLRGITIILMLMNLTPGSWTTNYAPLEHVPWAGAHLIDLVAPAFLFCIGAAMPLSFARRFARGDSRRTLLWHVVSRGLALVAIGFFLNLYPSFDFAHVRIPGVLQRIGLCYLLCGAFVLAIARRDAAGALEIPARTIAFVALFILVSYWILLYFVPVPGYGAPRFDPVGSWPSVIDRAVIGVRHFFQQWPVDGKVVFDPEGILSTWPACFNVLFGVLVGIAYERGWLALGSVAALFIGLILGGLALLARPWCPVIKNLWSSTFALFSAGFTLSTLALLTSITAAPVSRTILWPARIFGENPLLAYILVFLAAPLIDANWFGSEAAPRSLRAAGQAWFEGFVDPRLASLLFALAGIGVIFAVLVVCHRRRWILKL